MKDLDSRLRAADQIDVTDLWPDIEHRQPTTPPAEGTANRWLTMTVALVIGFGVIAAVIVAFTLRSTRPVAPATPGPAVTNGLIAFSGGPFGGPQILVMQAGGSSPVPITSGGAEEGTPEHPFPAWEPAWSPDGSQIAFRGFWGHGEASDLFVMNADGSNVRQLTRDANVTDPAWSPDGTTIAVSGFDGIYTIDATGGDLSRITPDSTQWHNHPTWSPDGTRIAYDRFVQGVDQIFIVAVDGTVDQQITDMPDGASTPSWSPDGTSIAFVGDVSGTADIYLMNVDGTGARPITTCDAPDCKRDSRPTWAPDGSLVALDRDLTGGSDIYTVQPDGSGLALLARNAFDPTWQPVLPGTPVLSEVELPGGLSPRRLAIGEGAVWVLGSKDPRATPSVLLHVDPETDQVVATIPLEGEPSYLASGGEAVWVGSPRSSELQRVDVETNEVTTPIQLPGDGVSAIAADGEDVWVEVIQDRSDQGQQNLASLVRIDARTSEVVATIPLEGLSGYDDEIAIGEGAVWVAGVNLTGPSEERGADLVRIDPSTNTIGAVIPISAFSVRVGANAVWVTSPADGVNDSLRKPKSWVAQEIDPITSDVSSPIALPGAVSAVLAVTEGGVWFSGYDNDGFIHPVRLRAGAFDSSMPSINSVNTDMVFDEASGTIWVAAISGLERIDIA